MTISIKYLWLVLLTALVIHGTVVVQHEWQRKSIHDHGALVEVTVKELNCSKGRMIFLLESIPFQKEIDARTCVVLNVGQKIKLKHSQQYPDLFLFVNERSPNRFILGGLEIALGILGLLANWPLQNVRRRADKKLGEVV